MFVAAMFGVAKQNGSTPVAVSDTIPSSTQVLLLMAQSSIDELPTSAIAPLASASRAAVVEAEVGVTTGVDDIYELLLQLPKISEVELQLEHA